MSAESLSKRQWMSAESLWERHWMSAESLWERHLMTAESVWERHLKSAESLWERHWKGVESLWERHLKGAESLWERHLMSEACFVQNKFEEIILEQSVLEGIALGVEGGDAPFHVLPVLEGVLPIRGIDGSTGEAIPMGTTSGLREASDPYRADVVRWAAMDVPSIMKEEDLTRLREEYRIPEDI
ncbi:hypothetical protein Adt_01937 [Abeliophyllum distichum]|uniref:Uncharacterized protein n=1 Tax=Abeliophyllum distichum TaxID=126358 RepID=A0ABD1VU82_9LAMI